MDHASPKHLKPFGGVADVQHHCPGNTPTAAMQRWPQHLPPSPGSLPPGLHIRKELRKASQHIFQGVKPHLRLCLRMDYGKYAQLTLLVQVLNPQCSWRSALCLNQNSPRFIPTSFQLRVTAPQMKVAAVSNLLCATAQMYCRLSMNT